MKAWIKYISSFFKSDWELHDYPIRFRHQKIGDSEFSGRLKSIPWTAQIIKWWILSGHGNTKEEALTDLRNKFSAFKAKNSLPRPGTKAPVQIDFASTTEINQYEHIAVGFFKKVLDMNYYECLITDESSLWDFHVDETNDDFNQKIYEAYGVDVSDIDGGNLAEIFQRIDLLSNNF